MKWHPDGELVMTKTRDKIIKPNPVSQGAAPDRQVSKNLRGATEPKISSQSEVAAFVEKMNALAPMSGEGRGRLVFAMDATMSRQPTWDLALSVQAEMFGVVRDVGGLDVQLVYFRGSGSCRASNWVSDPDGLKRLMTSVSCQGGLTQLGKVLSHVRKEAEKRKINAVVYVGDAMEEDIDSVCGRAGELALLGIPVFMFQEGHDGQAERAFREIARITKGRWCRFSSGAAGELRALLEAVAVYAAGGRKALQRLSHKTSHLGARHLLADLSEKG